MGILLFLAIVLAGYGIGRTIAEEKIFEDFRANIMYGRPQKSGDSYVVFDQSELAENFSKAVRPGFSWFYPSEDITEPFANQELTIVEDEGELDLDQLIEDSKDITYEVKSHNGYYPGKWGFVKGKLGDLLTCVVCLSAQASFWTTVIVLICLAFSITPLWILPASAVGSSYILSDVMSKLKK